MKQLSVFIENREGRLEDVLNLLKEENINIISLSLADTSDYGMLRLIVSDPQKGCEALKENGFSATLNDVVAVTLPHKVGALQEILHVLCKESLNVEYMYAFGTKLDQHAMIIFKTEDNRRADEILQEEGMHALTSEEVHARLYS